MPLDPPLVPTTGVSDLPEDWLHSTPLLGLSDTKLRLKARSLTQLSSSERAKAMAIYAFVKRMPYAKRIKAAYPTARDILEAKCGDGDDKVTLLMALLRAAGIPARIRYMEMKGEMLRGLVPMAHPPDAARPLAEIWLGRWMRTDTYIYDASYVAAARRQLRARGWAFGWGLHLEGDTLWNGKDDAFLGGSPIEDDPRLLRVLCLVSDPLELVAPTMRPNGLRYTRSIRALEWNVLAPAMHRAIERLRAPRAAEAASGAAAQDLPQRSR